MARPGLYFANDDALEELLTSDEARDFVIDAALRAKSAAVDVQPADTHGHEERIFAGGYEERVWESGGPKIATAYVGSFSGTWHLMEFGSAHNPPFRPLTTGVERAGIAFLPK